jgi:SpoVK/Ycf46/Vps4 family AAA+-type ATPase
MQWLEYFLDYLNDMTVLCFLTTNRENTTDEAFNSRISVSIKYDYLTQLQKSAIWKDLFDAFGMNNYEQYIEQLSQYSFNGRQIKNILRNNSFDFELFKKIVKFM